MRQVLVDHARQTGAAKRGGDLTKIQLADTLAFGSSDKSNSFEFLVLDQALSRLAELSPRKAQVIELRYFGGLGVVEIGEILDVSPATVSREQRLAEAWLAEALNPEANKM
jgi:RNA polymerase sigma-70 factor (ECF subfamily)